MELIAHQNKIIRSSESQGEERKFTIEASPQAFRILSDNLYSDKFKAIIRELSCNAVDAHIAAGTPQLPFEVHLPAWNNPEFSIRDFGTGLSKEDIDVIYTTYFKSTKSNSNDMIGCLGLGSKTPFAYTDSFLVESFFKGKKYTYTAFMNEEGVPSVRSLGDEETDLQNGMRISFAVKREDFNNFEYKAREVFKWFEVKPIVTSPNFFFEEIGTIQQEGMNWKLLDGGSGALAKMGNIVYPIEKQHLPNDFPETKRLLAYPVIFDFDIGDIDIAPNREALAYKKRTVEVIKARLAVFSKEVAEKTKEEIDKFNCWYDACLHARNKRWFNHGLVNDLITSGEIKYRGRELSQWVEELFKPLDKYKARGGYRTKIGYERKSTFNKYIPHNMTIDDKFVILDAPKCKMGERKLNETLLYNDYRNWIVVDSSIVSAKDLEELIDIFGIDEKYIISFEDLEPIPVEPKEKRSRVAVSLGGGAGKKIAQVWTLKGSCGSKPREYWSHDPIEVDLADTKEKKYYVEIEKFEIKQDKAFPNFDISACVILNQQFVLKGFKSVSSVYGLTERQVNKIARNPSWIKFSSFIEEAATEFLKKFTPSDMMKYRTISSIITDDLSTIIDNSCNKQLKELLEELIKYKNDNQDYDQFIKVCASRIFNNLPSNSVIRDDYQEFVNLNLQSERFYEKLKEHDPDWTGVKFVDLCKKYPILFKYSNELARCAKIYFGLSTVSKIIDMLTEAEERV